MISEAEKEMINKIMDKKPTRHRHIALRDHRPWLPTCDHEGCKKASEKERGSGKRRKLLCEKHFTHPDYRRLRSVYCGNVLQVIVYA